MVAVWPSILCVVVDLSRRMSVPLLVTSVPSHTDFMDGT